MSNHTPDYYDTLAVQRGVVSAFEVAADDARKLRRQRDALLETHERIADSLERVFAAGKIPDSLHGLLKTIAALSRASVAAAEGRGKP